MKLFSTILHGITIFAAFASASPLSIRSPDDGSIRIPVKGVPEPEKRDDGAIRIPVKGVPEPEKRDDGAIRIPVKGVPERPTEE
ncbi:hypothetical protein BDV24DRAFT_132204 [Aspergillus arachidicola]|uniref:Uncharacterized protein n=1 Tax=Aspergillus arachidicola TaxID=656916 RepID=A0A5N6Y7V9_9EURO|nr:hypothetical protein BDV24DRAFT_132204 [Aspergillus arachidicola]